LKRRSKVLETVKRETDGASKIKKKIFRNKNPKWAIQIIHFI